MGRSRSNSRSKGTTNPDYSVEEDKFGRLVNKEKRLIWPSKKHLSTKDFKQFLSTAPAVGEKEEYPDSSSEKFPKSESCLTFHEKYNYGKEDDDVFIGAATPEEASKKVPERTNFCIYYRLGDTLQTELPLFMAYQRSNGEVMHFPVIRTSYRRGDNLHSEFYWHVDAGREERNRQFTSLAALVKYYHLFSYYDPANGQIETFPFFN